MAERRRRAIAAPARPIAFAFAIAIASAPCGAQTSEAHGGKWRSSLGAGASVASGNRESTSLNLTADATRATADDKWTLRARVVSGRSDGVSAAGLTNGIVRYERDIEKRWIAFGQAEYLRDTAANLQQRGSLASGLGYRIDDSARATWTVFAGIGYSADTYYVPRQLAGALRDSYSHGELLLGSESQYRIGRGVELEHRLYVYPNLTDTGALRATYDAGLTSPLSDSIGLKLTLGYRYNSDPGAGLKKGDLLFVSGLTIRFE